MSIIVTNLCDPKGQFGSRAGYIVPDRTQIGTRRSPSISMP
jgi:hypothetical protein